MKKRNIKRKISAISLATLALVGPASAAGEPFDPAAAFTAASGNMTLVITGGMAVVGVGLAVRLGIKMLKRMTSAV